eukprot:scpid36637/ scgid7445/ 
MTAQFDLFIAILLEKAEIDSTTCNACNSYKLCIVSPTDIFTIFPQNVLPEMKKKLLTAQLVLLSWIQKLQSPTSFNHPITEHVLEAPRVAEQLLTKSPWVKNSI